MGQRLRTKREPKKKAVNAYTKQYYYARSLYFEHRLSGNNEIEHAHTSSGIAEMVSKEFNAHVPASTIRRWAITPDREFEGRTWAGEWQQRLDIGIIQAVSNQGCNEHSAITRKPIDNNRLTPMQSLTELSRRSIQNDIELVSRIENLFRGLSDEIQHEYETTGKINSHKLKVLLPYYIGAKERFFANIEKLNEIERTMDSELLYGSHVALKDPQARERVRNAMLKFMNIAHQKSLEMKASGQH